MKKSNLRFKKNQKEKFPKLFIGVSTNHKEVDGEHSKLKFKNKWLGLDGFINQIEDNGFFYPPITNVDDDKNYPDGYKVHSAINFTEASVIPFDIDKAKCSMEDFIAKLPDDLIPTIAFKTRSNDDEKGDFRFRFLYLFTEPFKTREVYFSAYEAIKEDIKRYTGGDFGKDEYAYGLNPNGDGRKGSCCKPIRTNKSSEIMVYGHYYNQSEFYIPIIFNDLEYDVSDKINRDLFSPDLYDRVMKYHYTSIPYSIIPFRDFSITKSEFHNGFAYVRGNYNFAEFIRKFEPIFDDDGKRVKNPITGKVSYRASKWSVGEHRHTKLWMDALIARFNDYMDNGTCTLTGDELFMVLYDEAIKWFEVTDKGGYDSITCKLLLENASQAMSMDINEVIAEVVEYNKNLDMRKMGKRPICRIDYSYWNNVGLLSSKDAIKSLVRHTAKFLQLLKIYNPNLSLNENVAAIDSNKSASVPPHSISTLSKFINDCKDIDRFNKCSKTMSKDALMDMLFSEKGIDAVGIPDFSNYVMKFLVDEIYRNQFQSIISKQGNCYWNQVRSGAKVKPKNGRPKSEWQSILRDCDCLLPLNLLVDKIHADYPDVNILSIKTWKYRQRKKRG